MMKQSKRSSLSNILIGFILMFLVFGAYFLRWQPLETLEYKFYDFGLLLRVKSAASPIAVVAIDDDSITKLGRWPLPRTQIASMIEHLQNAGAKIIGLNIIFPNGTSIRVLLKSATSSRKSMMPRMHRSSGRQAAFMRRSRSRKSGWTTMQRWRRLSPLRRKWFSPSSSLSGNQS
jgi:CHASE2 domain-containing sensor protein